MDTLSQIAVVLLGLIAWVSFPVVFSTRNGSVS